MYRVLALTLTAAMACNREPADTDPPTDTDVAADTCPDLDVAACAQDTSCTTISGGQILPGNEGFPTCAFAPVELGCMRANVDCGDAITRAADPVDPSRCYQFTSTCVPAGWVPCDPDPGAPTEACDG